jgi:hypothetical protein
MSASDTQPIRGALGVVLALAISPEQSPAPFAAKLTAGLMGSLLPLHYPFHLQSVSGHKQPERWLNEAATRSRDGFEDAAA